MTLVQCMLIKAIKVPINLKSSILGSSWNLNPSFNEGFILTMMEINLNVYLNMTILLVFILQSKHCVYLILMLTVKCIMCVHSFTEYKFILI